MISGVIFDLDGTLVDSEVLWVEAIGTALNDRGHHITHDQAVELIYGRSWLDIYADIEVCYPGAYPSRKAMEKRVVPEVERMCDARDTGIASSVGLLRRLGACLPLAIVSGSTCGTIAACIRRLDIGAFVDAVVGCEEYPHGKPDPGCFLLGAKRLGVPPAECIVFEDSEVGSRGAKTAGMYCVALQRPGRPRQDVFMADLVLPDLDGFDLRAFEKERR